MTNHHFDQISSSPAPHADRDASEGPDLLAALQGSLEVIRATRHRLAPHAASSPGEDPMRDDAAVEASFVNPDGGVEAHLPDRGSSNRGTSRGPAAREGSGEREAQYAAALRQSPNGPWLRLAGAVDIAPSFVPAVMALADAEIEAAVEAATADLRGALALAMSALTREVEAREDVAKALGMALPEDEDERESFIAENLFDVATRFRAERDAALATVARVEAAMRCGAGEPCPCGGWRAAVTVPELRAALTEPVDSKGGE